MYAARRLARNKSGLRPGFQVLNQISFLVVFAVMWMTDVSFWPPTPPAPLEEGSTATDSFQRNNDVEEFFARFEKSKTKCSFDGVVVNNDGQMIDVTFTRLGVGMTRSGWQAVEKSMLATRFYMLLYTYIHSVCIAVSRSRLRTVCTCITTIDPAYTDKFLTTKRPFSPLDHKFFCWFRERLNERSSNRVVELTSKRKMLRDPIGSKGFLHSHNLHSSQAREKSWAFTKLIAFM